MSLTPKYDYEAYMTTRHEYKGDKNLRKEKLLTRNTIETIVNGKKTEVEDQKLFMGKQVEPSFVKLYLDDIDILCGISKSTCEVLFEFLNYMNYEGEITINSLVKKKVCAKLQIKNIGSINNHLTTLVKKNIFKRIDRGVYFANPYVFAKGDWGKNIKKLRAAYKENND